MTNLNQQRKAELWHEYQQKEFDKFVGVSTKKTEFEEPNPNLSMSQMLELKLKEQEENVASLHFSLQQQMQATASDVATHVRKNKHQDLRFAIYKLLNICHVILYSLY